MDTLSLTHLLNALAMIALPIGTGLYLTRRWRLSGRIWLADAPQTDSSWDAIVRVLQLDSLTAFYKANGLDFELIDLRSLLPLDSQTILDSVRRTGRVAVVHEAPLTGGFGGEIAATVGREAFEWLDAPVARLGALDTPVPFAKALEALYSPRGRLLPALRAVLLQFAPHPVLSPPRSLGLPQDPGEQAPSQRTAPPNVRPLSPPTPPTESQQGFQWGEAFKQYMMMLTFQHIVRLPQGKTHSELGGPFWADYVESVASLRGWPDGDSAVINYDSDSQQWIAFEVESSSCFDIQTAACNLKISLIGSGEG